MVLVQGWMRRPVEQDTCKPMDALIGVYFIRRKKQVVTAKQRGKNSLFNKQCWEYGKKYK